MKCVECRVNRTINMWEYGTGNSAEIEMRDGTPKLFGRELLKNFSIGEIVVIISKSELDKLIQNQARGQR